MKIALFYRVYQDSPAATLVNTVMRFAGFFMAAVGLLLLAETDTGKNINILLIAGGVAVFILGNVFGNMIAKKQTKKKNESEKNGSR